jgi:hypothetical protein
MVLKAAAFRFLRGMALLRAEQRRCRLRGGPVASWANGLATAEGARDLKCTASLSPTSRGVQQLARLRMRDDAAGTANGGEGGTSERAWRNHTWWMDVRSDHSGRRPTTSTHCLATAARVWSGAPAARQRTEAQHIWQHVAARRWQVACTSHLAPRSSSSGGASSQPTRHRPVAGAVCGWPPDVLLGLWVGDEWWW